MKRAAKINRSVLIYSLVLSLSAIGFCPRPLAARTGQLAKAASSLQAPRFCCCGTPDGNCGMACCVKRASNTPPVETPARPTNNARQFFQLAVQISSLAALSDAGSGAAHRDLSLDSALAVHTLQTQHVRIQA